MYQSSPALSPSSHCALKLDAQMRVIVGSVQLGQPVRPFFETLLDDAEIVPTSYSDRQRILFHH
jgi:hypothetical protein